MENDWRRHLMLSISRSDQLILSSKGMNEHTTPAMKNRGSSVKHGSGLSVRSCAARKGEAAKTLFFMAEKRWRQ